jgi:hypothetical protein
VRPSDQAMILPRVKNTIEPLPRKATTRFSI